MDLHQSWYELSFAIKQIWSSFTWEVREHPLLMVAVLAVIYVVWRILRPHLK